MPFSYLTEFRQSIRHSRLIIQFFTNVVSQSFGPSLFLYFLITFKHPKDKK